MRKMLGSLMLIGVVGGAVFVTSSAFFSDTETSTENHLRTGAVDLLVSNHSYYNGLCCDGGEWVGQEENCFSIWKIGKFDDSVDEFGPSEWTSDPPGQPFTFNVFDGDGNFPRRIGGPDEHDTGALQTNDTIL